VRGAATHALATHAAATSAALKVKKRLVKRGELAVCKDRVINNVS
jgi:hypothetical protein